MIEYIIVIILCLTLAVYDDAIKKLGIGKLLYFLICCYLFLMAACREYTVGRDTLQYVNAYEKLIVRDAYEPGFKIFLNILYEINPNYEFLIVISSVLILVPVFLYIYRNAANRFLSLYFFITLNFFATYMNVMRQAIAIAIIIVGWELYKNTNKIIFFGLFVVIATMFHYSAIITLMFPVIDKYELDYRFIFCIVLLSSCLFFWLKEVFVWIAYNIEFAKYYEYVGSQYMNSNYFGAVLQFLTWAMIFCVIYKFMKSNSNFNIRTKNFYINTIFATVIILLFSIKVGVVERFRYFFDIFSIVSLSYLHFEFEENRKNILLFIMCFIAFAYWMIIATFRPEWFNIVPYKTYL